MWVIEGAMKWQVLSNIKFTGWGICQFYDKGLRVGGGSGKSYNLLGTELDGVHRGLGIKNSHPKRNTANARTLITSLATRALGRALGFQHEDLRSDTESNKCDGIHRREYCGDFSFGTYDFNSVLAPRNKNPAMSLNLSGTDIRMVQLFYGTSRALDIPEDGLPVTPNCALTSTSAFGKGWNIDNHIRVTEDINGDGFSDIVGISQNGIHTALSLGDDQFSEPRLVLDKKHCNERYSYDAADTLADVNNDGMLDIIDFISERFGNHPYWDQSQGIIFYEYSFMIKSVKWKFKKTAKLTLL